MGLETLDRVEDLVVKVDYQPVILIFITPNSLLIGSIMYQYWRG